MESCDFSFYKNVYGGNVIPSEMFDLFTSSAIMYINFITLGRLAQIHYTDEIKFAICAIADFEFLHTGKEIESENVGEYSIKYAAEKDNLAKREYQLARKYLANSGLLFRGV